MKKIIWFISLVILSTSCSEYQKVLKDGDPGVKYAMGEKLYNEAEAENSKSKYRKALRLFEQIVPQYRGKPQGEKLTFLFADTYYKLNDHYLAGSQFERFPQSYPNSDRVEEAAFKSARSYYLLSPRYDLDQTETIKAIEELQKYIVTHPEGENIKEANELATDLRLKLEKKAYQIAWEYHRKGNSGIPGENYKAAIVAFTNFLKEHPGSPFREAAIYYRYDAAYQLAINSYQHLVQERLIEAQEYYNNYIRFYPEGGQYYDQIQKSYRELDFILQIF